MTDVRALPQHGPLESPAADKLRVVYETGRGTGAGEQPCRGERAGKVRPTRTAGTLLRPPQGGCWPCKGPRVDVGGHALRPQHVPSASAFLAYGVRNGVSSAGFL